MLSLSIRPNSVQLAQQISKYFLMNRTAIIWDVGSGKSLQTIDDHKGEIYDLEFSLTGDKLITGSADSTARLYSVNTSACLQAFEGTIELNRRTHRGSNTC